MQNIVPKFCCFLELLFCLIPIQALLASGSASLQTEFQSNSLPVANDRPKDITDALYQIAQVLQDNQQHSSLYERISSLEASLSLSIEQNKLLENRIKDLEDQIPDMNAKIEMSSSLLEKTEALEASTNDVMEGFEEKLSTIVGEILRWKNLVHKSKEIGGVSSSNRLDDVIVEASREVELSKSTKSHHKNYVKSQKLTNEHTIVDSSVADQKIQFEEIRELCPPVLPSGSAENDYRCLFTSEGTLVNWTMADRLCQLEGGSLASFHDVETVDFLKGNNIKFWIFTAPDEKFLQDKEKILEENYKYFGDGSASSRVPVSNVQYIEAENSDSINSEHINMLRLSEIVAQDSLENSSGDVDIRNLPYFKGEIDVKSDKNVYVSNVQSDESKSAQSIVALVSDDGSGDFEANYSAKKSLEGSDSLSKPQDAITYKEFLLLESADLENNEDHIEYGVSDEMPVFKTTPNGRPMSDSSSDPISVSLFSLLKGETSSNFIRQDIKRDEKVNKKCPLLLCTEDSQNCLVIKRPCMELNSFWCKRKG